MKTTVSGRTPVNVAFAGLGRAVFKDHAPVFATHRDKFHVIAACDLMKDRRDAISEVFPDCRMFRRLDDMFDERDIELVVVATRTNDHEKHASQALSRGFWTAVESPLATTVESAQRICGICTDAASRLIPVQRGLFEPEFLAAQAALRDGRLGEVHHVTAKKFDYWRRNDWQTIASQGGGAVFYAMPDLALQVVKLLNSKPCQMWSELMRISSWGDAEDFVHLRLRTASRAIGVAEFDGSALDNGRVAAIVLRGERGLFAAKHGGRSGTLCAIEPSFQFPKRRASIKSPHLGNLRDQFPIVNDTISIPDGTPAGCEALWLAVYDTIRKAVPFPVRVDEAIETIRLAQLMRKSANPFGS